MSLTCPRLVGTTTASFTLAEGALPFWTYAVAGADGVFGCLAFIALGLGIDRIVHPEDEAVFDDTLKRVAKASEKDAQRKP